MDHSYQFRVWGDTFPEVQQKARDTATSYFGDLAYTLDIDAEALHAVSGQVLTIEARCHAWAKETP